MNNRCYVAIVGCEDYIVRKVANYAEDYLILDVYNTLLHSANRAMEKYKMDVEPFGVLEASIIKDEYRYLYSRFYRFLEELKQLNLTDAECRWFIEMIILVSKGLFPKYFENE